MVGSSERENRSLYPLANGTNLKIDTTTVIANYIMKRSRVGFSLRKDKCSKVENDIAYYRNIKSQLKQVSDTASTTKNLTLAQTLYNIYIPA